MLKFFPSLIFLGVLCIQSIKSEINNFSDGDEALLDYEVDDYDVQNADDCKCNKGTCVKNVCTCPPEFGVYKYLSTVECRPCKCGKESNCTMDVSFWLTKINCICKQGYQIVDEKCKGPCTDNPCKNGGTCVDVNKSFKCVCPNGYTGLQCQTKYACSPNPCENEGKCVVNGTGFQCECLTPYYGEKCETHPCHYNPCKNDGACIAVENTYGCVCHEPFTGSHCEIDPCSSSPCQNEGVCSIVGIDFNCSCEMPYSGKHCELDPCSSHPCMNGGHCSIKEMSAYCNCLEGFYGPTCEDIVNDTSTFDYSTSTKEPLTTENEDNATVEDCYCGINSLSCHRNRGKKVCVCKQNYAQRNETCAATCIFQYECLNDGVCVREGLANFCVCSGAFIGDRCQIDVCEDLKYTCGATGEECVRKGDIGVCQCPEGKVLSRLSKKCIDKCDDRTCVHGRCVIIRGVKQCICDEGFIGDNCNITMISIDTPQWGVLIVLAIILVVFTIAAIVAICWVKRLKETLKKTSGLNTLA